jgi:hypothetical protein
VGFCDDKVGCHKDSTASLQLVKQGNASVMPSVAFIAQRIKETRVGKTAY